MKQNSNLKIVRTEYFNFDADKQIGLAEKLKKYMEFSGVSPKSIADLFGINIPELNKLDLDNSVLNEIEKFLGIETHAYQNPKELIHSETSISKMITNTLTEVRENSLIGLLKGKPGIGKTQSIKTYQSLNPCTYLINITRATKSMNSVIKLIQDAITEQRFYRTTMSPWPRVVELMEFFRKCENPLLIIDESDYCSLDAVDLTRTFNDEMGLPIAMVGLKNLDKKLHGNTASQQQLLSRISLSIELPEPTKKDFYDIIDENWYKLNEEVKREMFNCCHGSLRVFRHLNFHLRKYMQQQENRGRLNPEAEDIEIIRNLIPYEEEN